MSKNRLFDDTFPLRPKTSRGQIELILKQVKALIEFSNSVWGFLDSWTASVPKIVSKCQSHALARGPPKSAEGQTRGKGKGECFAPFSFKNHEKFMKISSFWCGNPYNFILAQFRKKTKISPKTQKNDFLTTQFLSKSRLPVIRSSSYSSKLKL